MIESDTACQEYVNQHPEFGFEQLKDYTKEAIRKKNHRPLNRFFGIRMKSRIG